MEIENLIYSVEGVLHPSHLYEEKSLNGDFLNVAKGIVDNNWGFSENPITFEYVNGLQQKLSSYFVEVAPDLATFSLAEGHISRLTDFLINNGAKKEGDLLIGGAIEFYKIGRDLLGPIWTSYVNEVLESGKGDETYIFAARDATPIFWAAEGLRQNCDNCFNLEGSKFVHVDWNRWFMGQEDELDASGKPTSFSNPILKDFYLQMGFGTGKTVKIVEPGAWGSAANALKTFMPDQPFELWFLFSHMPDKIYGFLNTLTPEIDSKYFEMINDTGEATPKPYLRPTKLTTQNGKVVANIEDKVIKSPHMQLWSWAVNQGAHDAGVLFARGKRESVHDSVQRLIELSKTSAEGKWTGVLPRNTLTWTEGENWKANWKWGKIPPLK